MECLHTDQHKVYDMKTMIDEYSNLIAGNMSTTGYTRVHIHGARKTTISSKAVWVLHFSSHSSVNDVISHTFLEKCIEYIYKIMHYL